MDIRFNRDLQAEQNASERLLDCSETVFSAIRNRIEARIIIFCINLVLNSYNKQTYYKV